MSISYRKRGKKGLWDYRIFDEKKKLVKSNSGFSTKKEAEIEAISLDLQIKKGIRIDNTISLFDLWEKWYQLTIIPLKKSEGTNLKHYYRGKRIKENFGETPINDITYSEYQTFINRMAKELGRDSVSRLNSEIRNVINFGKRDKLAIYDFTKGVVITGKDNSKRASEKYLTSISDFQKLVIYLEVRLKYSESVIPYILYTQAKTGLRLGEVLGLTDDCLNLEKFEIKTYRRFDSNKKRWVSPKTETSIRTVPIDQNLKINLEKLLIERNEFHSSLQINNPDKFLFYDWKTGVPTSAGVNKHLREVLKKLSIKPSNLTSTGLRHTYPSILLSKGIDIWTIAKIMGHKDIKQITETYGHLINEKENLEVEKIREFFGNI